MNHFFTPFDDLAWCCNAPLPASVADLVALVATKEKALAKRCGDTYKPFDAARLRTNCAMSLFDVGLFGHEDTLQFASQQPITWADILYAIHKFVAACPHLAGRDVYFGGLDLLTVHPDGKYTFIARMGR